MVLSSVSRNVSGTNHLFNLPTPRLVSQNSDKLTLITYKMLKIAMIPLQDGISQGLTASQALGAQMDSGWLPARTNMVSCPHVAHAISHIFSIYTVAGQTTVAHDIFSIPGECTPLHYSRAQLLAISAAPELR